MKPMKPMKPMKIDEVGSELREVAKRAEARVGVDKAALRARGLRRSGWALVRLRVWLVIELALNALAAVWLGSFLAAHVTEPRFVVCGVLLDAVAIAQVIATVRQLVGLARVELGGPLVPAQRALERLEVERIRVTVATLLAAPLLWVPLLAVALEALFEVDVFHALPARWIVINVVAGAAFVPAMLLVARRFADRFRGSPLLRRVLRDLAGRNLSAAQTFLAELAELESAGA